jgi:hypothetical protein
MFMVDTRVKSCRVPNMSTSLAHVPPHGWEKVLEDRRDHVEHAKTRLKLARDAQKAAVLGAIAAGWTEVDAARVSGLDRGTVRAWRGKT